MVKTSEKSTVVYVKFDVSSQWNIVQLLIGMLSWWSVSTDNDARSGSQKHQEMNKA